MSERQGKKRTNNKNVLATLPDVMTKEILTNSSCKDIIKTLSSSTDMIKKLELTATDFELLAANIDPNNDNGFNELTEVDQEEITEDYGTYRLKTWPLIARLTSDATIQRAANMFYTKCLYQYLCTKYTVNDIRRYARNDLHIKYKWYEAIAISSIFIHEYARSRETKIQRAESAKDDLKEFQYFTTVHRLGRIQATYQYRDPEDAVLPIKIGTRLIIPDTVRTIEGNACAGLDLMNGLIIGNNVTDIGPYAFAGTGLSGTLKIGNNVTDIGAGAFSQNALKALDIGTNVTHIGHTAFRYNKLKSLTIPDNVTSLGDAAFSFNRLEFLTIGSGITFISQYAFSDNNLIYVFIPDTIIDIYKGAFESNKIVNLSLGKRVSSIGPSAFRDNKLTSVRLPDSLLNTMLFKGAFDKGVHLEEKKSTSGSSNNLKRKRDDNKLLKF